MMPFNYRVTGFVMSPSFSGTSINSSRASSPSQLHLSFLGFHFKPPKRSSRCHVKDPRPPSPESGPPFQKDILPVVGLESTVSKFQDRAQIFFAVLFWISLFFWSCASDGKNDGGPTKGSGFRR